MTVGKTARRHVSQPTRDPMPNTAEYAKLLEPGTILAGKYRVDGVLGKGGMGVVVAATHLALEQRVALKFLLPAALESPEATERFSREARAAVRLRSEHVARVLDVGQLESGSPYMVMELLDGQDLADRLATKEPIPVAQAVDYVLQAGEAVAEAHALGIIHRDLKPRNLFLTESVHGRPLVKVLDFGISKTVNGEELSLTRTSAIMGSPNYMSPEQLGRPRDVDGRSDVWSLGVILYELLAGRIPFRASTLTELCARVFQEEPERLEKERPEVPVALADVVHRCLAKKLDVRFASVVEMARALAPFTSDPTIVERIERVASLVPPPAVSVARSSRASVTSLTPLPGQVSTSVSWSEASDLVAPLSQDGDTRLLAAPPRRARLFPIFAAGGALVVAIGAAALTVTLTRHHDTVSVTRTNGVALGAGGAAGGETEPGSGAAGTVTATTAAPPLTATPPTPPTAIADAAVNDAPRTSSSSLSPAPATPARPGRAPATSAPVRRPPTTSGSRSDDMNLANDRR